MPTRHKKPSIIKQLAISITLGGFLAYLGASALSGQFGLGAQDQMLTDISELTGKSATLQAEIDSLKHRKTLFEPTRLDPDILTERARALLSMAPPDDIILLPTTP